MQYPVTTASGSAAPQGDLRLAAHFKDVSSSWATSQAGSENPALSAALDYAARGWPVFPCSPVDKAPLIDGGFKSASKNPRQIRRWWRQFPKAMIGVPTGPETGNVIDLDLGDPPAITGSEYFTRFEAYVGGIPSSPLVFSFVPRCQGLWGSQK
jgi:hypothetical protein